MEVRKEIEAKETIGVKMKHVTLRWFGHVERLMKERMTK